MDLRRLDTITEMLVSTLPRRAGARLLAAGALWAALGVHFRLLSQVAGADHFGCRHLAEQCRRDDQCCSGKCRGSGGAKRCRAHHAENCTVDNGFCRSGGSAPGRCGPNGTCVCNVTTGRAPHCGGTVFCPPVPCQRDADCGEPGAACIDVAACQGCGPQATENFCQRPCGS